MLHRPDNLTKLLDCSLERDLKLVPIRGQRDWARLEFERRQRWLRHRAAHRLGWFVLSVIMLLLGGQLGFGQESQRLVEGQHDPYWQPNEFVQSSARRVARTPASTTAFRKRDPQEFQESQPGGQVPVQGRILVDPQDVLNGLNLSRPNNAAPFRAREFQEQGGAFVSGGRPSDATRLEPVPFSFNEIPVDQLKPDPNENASSDPQEGQTREQLPAPIRSTPTESNPRVQRNDPETEVITENYADGKPRLIRTVKMDEDGNYYNHGPWKVLNQSGDVVAQGNYKLGLMDGIWGRRHLASEGGLFATKPFSFYTGPFDSFANFKDGKLHGTWVIYNQNGVGQKVFEIEYLDGKRHGQAVWYYPDQHRYRQATFKQGVLDGDVLEWDSSPDHQLASRDRYFEGRKLVQTTASYRPDAKLSVETYLDQKLIPEGEDNWWAAKPTPFVPQGQRVQEGPVASWYPNQQPKHRGQYKDDHPVGTFYWWHENGNRKSRGSFDSDGQRHGTWIWWHANGMKQFEGQYSHGEPKGLWRSWFEDGQLRKEKNYDAPKLMGADQFDIDTLNDDAEVDSATPAAKQDDEPEEQGTTQTETEPASGEPGELPVPDQQRETIEPIDAIPLLIDEGTEA